MATDGVMGDRVLQSIDIYNDHPFPSQPEPDVFLSPKRHCHHAAEFFHYPMKHLILPALVIAYCLSLAGCGDEGPFGNTPPQGRPDWMKKKEGNG